MYGKIFESMYDGTLSGDWKAMVTFQQFIVLADSEGIVDYTPQALSRRTGIPLDILEHGISKLQESDPYSRSTEMDGQRIELIDDHRPWGWYIVNYEQYRDLASMEDKREKDRIRIAAKRKALKNKGVAGSREVSQPVANVAHEDIDIDIDIDINVDTDINPKAWAEYVQHRKEKKKKITPLSETKQKNMLRRFSHEQQQQMVDTTIKNGWTGIFTPDSGPSAKLSYAEQLKADLDATTH